MICRACVKEISNTAKYCTNCGKETFIGNPRIRYNHSSRFASIDEFYYGQERKISFLNVTIEISKEQDCFNYYRRNFTESGAAVTQLVVRDFFNKFKNVVEIIEGMNSFVYDNMVGSFRTIEHYLKLAGIYNEDYIERCAQYIESGQLLYQQDLQFLVDRYNEILFKEREKTLNRASFLPSFIVSHSVVGYIASSLFSHGVNKIVESKVNSKIISTEKQKMIWEQINFELWFDHIYEDLKNLNLYFFKQLKEFGVMNYDLNSSIDRNNAEKHYHLALKSESEIENTTDALRVMELCATAISYNPYQEKYYHLLRRLTERYGDDINKIEFDNLIDLFVFDDLVEKIEGIEMEWYDV